MDTEKNMSETTTTDLAAYGGSRYRLSYDKYQGDSKKYTIKRTGVAAVLVIAVVFFLLGFIIYRYYDSSIRRFFSDPDDTSRITTTNFQSYFGADTNTDS